MCRANQEQNDPNARPAITGAIPNLSEYDVIFLGYPIWHGQAPKVIYTFLEGCEGWNGQTIIPFCTSGSSPIGSSADNLHSLIPSSIDWMNGRRFSSNAPQSDVTAWVEGLNLNQDRNNNNTNSSQKEKWKNLCCIGAVKTEFEHKGVKTEEWHYYISNLNMLRKFALSLIKQFKTSSNSKRPISQIMFHCLLDPLAISAILEN